METRLQEWVRQYLANMLGVPGETIALNKTLADYGLDSVDAVLMAGELEEASGVEVEPAAFIQYANFAAMIDGLARDLTQA